LKITQDIFGEAATMVELDKGMADNSAEFLEKGGKLYP
jgi:phosphomethylpyrimidine synthase